MKLDDIESKNRKGFTVLSAESLYDWSARAMRMCLKEKHGEACDIKELHGVVDMFASELHGFIDGEVKSVMAPMMDIDPRQTDMFASERGVK